VVVEGYIDGPEFSLDALVFGGFVQVSGFADRHIRFPPYFIEIGHTIPTELPAAEQAALVREFERAVRALGINHGAAKGDVKLSSRGPVIGEIAARLSGGYMSGWTYPLSSGVALTEAALRIALGDPPGSLSPAWQRTSAERAVISMPGRLVRVEGAGEVRALPGIAEYFQMREAGAELHFPRSNVEKVGNVISAHESREDAVRSAELAVGSLLPVLEPRSVRTDDFLFGAVPEGSGVSALGQNHHWAYDPRLSEFSDLPGESRSPASVLDAWKSLRNSRGVGLPAPETWVPRSVARALEGSTAKDWAFRSPGETLARLGGVPSGAGRPGREALPPALTVVFWRAFLRGGLQGIRYVADSLAVEPL
jgi:hypothetical protein